MKIKKGCGSVFWVTCICLLTTHELTAQSSQVSDRTAGHSTLLEIEGRARQIDQNENRMRELNGLIAQSITEEQNRLNQMTREINELELKRGSEIQNALNAKRNEIENATVWRNRRQSAQSGWKEYRPGTCNAGGPPPICPYNHWYRVSVDEAMREYNRMVQDELDKVRGNIERDYDRQLQNRRDARQKFQFEDNEFSRRRADWHRQLNQLQAQNNNHRDEIARLSRVYRENVVKGVENMTMPWISELMRLVAEKHFLELRIDIVKVRQQDLKAEQSDAEHQARVRVQEETEKLVAERNNRIAVYSRDLQQLDIDYREKLGELQRNRGSILTDLRTVEEKLRNRNSLSNDEITVLEVEERQLRRDLDSVDGEIRNLNTSAQREGDRLRTTITNLRNDIWQINIDQPAKQRDAVERVQLAFQTREKILNDAIDARVMNLRNNIETTRTRLTDANSKMRAFDAVMEAEKNRLINACRSAGASCFGYDTPAAGMHVWSSSESCVGAMESLRNQGVYYGCEREAPVYRQAYNSRVNGLSDSDIQALNRRTTQTRFNTILNSIN